MSWLIGLEALPIIFDSKVNSMVVQPDGDPNILRPCMFIHVIERFFINKVNVSALFHGKFFISVGLVKFQVANNLDTRVKKWKGCFTLQSIPGEGTTIKMEMPIKN